MRTQAIDCTALLEISFAQRTDRKPVSNHAASTLALKELNRDHEPATRAENTTTRTENTTTRTENTDSQFGLHVHHRVGGRETEYCHHSHR